MQWTKPRGVALQIHWLTLLALMVPSAPATAQAVYGSIAGTVTDSSGASVPDVIITIASVERNTADTAVSDSSGFFRKDRLLPGVYGVAAVRAGFKTANAPSIKVSLDTETRVELVLQPGAHHGNADRGGAGTASEDGPGGRLDSLRRPGDQSPPGSGSQLHEIPAAHAWRNRGAVATRVEREPAGLGPNHGQRPALRRDGLPARWHREPRPHPRDHRDQSEPRGGGGGKDHVTELRCGVRAGDGRRRVGADQVRLQRVARQCVRVLPQRSLPGAKPVHTAQGPTASHNRTTPVRRLFRRANPERQALRVLGLPGAPESRRRVEAAHGAHRARANRRLERVRRDSLRSGGGRSRRPPAFPRSDHP